MTRSRPPDHFRRLYQAKPDPWDFESSDYEQAKYRHTLSVLGEQRFRSALEVGCSIGVLTHLLASRCDRLLGVDIVDDPLPAARARCAAQPWVRFARIGVPAAWPPERFDLIVLSEVLYFLSASDITLCARRVAQSLTSHGRVVLVNWLGQSDDPVSGEAAAEAFLAAFPGPLLTQERQPGYRLDVAAAPAPAVASA